jgi:hypothetical protein
MLTQVTRLVIAFIVALGVAMPTGVGAMSMPDSLMGKAMQRPCQHCPQPQQSGSTSPDKMPGCSVVACVGAVALIPGPVLLPCRALIMARYVIPASARPAGAAPAPDPFPPRPVVLL